MAPAKLIVYTQTLLCGMLPSVMSANESASENEWTLVWADEFDYVGSPDPEKWGYDLGAGGWGNGERQTYTDDLANARVENGSLLIQAVQADGNTRAPSYTSARLTTREKKSIQYGRVEVRAILPYETGTWAAIWMLSTDALLSDVYWPNNGEIDIVETVGYENDPLFLQIRGVEFLSNVHSTLHTEARNHRSAGGIGGSTFSSEIYDQFNTYALEWFPDRIEFFFNGESYLRVDRDRNAGIPGRNRPDDLSPWWPFDQRFHLILNIAVGGSWGGHFNQEFYPTSPYAIGINDGGDWPQTMEVDYVRMYQHESLCDSPITAIPGMVDPLDYVAERGVIHEHSSSQNSLLNLTSLQSGDFVEYDLQAAEPGTYRIHLEYAASDDNQAIRVVNTSTGSETTADPISSSNGDWVMNQIGEIELQRGPNRIRLEAQSNDLRLGALELDAPSNGTWKGFPLDALNVANTGDWLGPIGTQFAPWIFHPATGSWIYLPSALDAAITPQSEWMWIQQPTGLEPTDQDFAPWYYSTTADKWFYASNAPDSTGLAQSQWVYLFQP